jgi:phage recombination protein Bet
MTTTAITTADDNSIIDVLRNSLYPGASVPSVQLVLSYCRAANLDPMQKPVHIVPMWDGKAKQMRDVVMPGIGLYRTQASRTGQCAGVSEPIFGPDVEGSIGGLQIVYPAWCKVTVKRVMDNGQMAEYTAVERWVENYAVKGGPEKSIAPNAMWTKRPYGQLAKCAEAQALRKAFPELGSAPTAEEMEGKPLDPNTIDVPAPPPNPWNDDLKAAADAASKQGMTEYTKWWKAQSNEFREAAIHTKEHEKFKKASADATAAASEAPPVDEQPATAE